jgi:hypothetical protein
MSRFSQTCPLFQASKLCPGGFYNFPKMYRFLAYVNSHIHFFGGLYVIVCSSRRARFNLRIYFFSPTSSGSECMLTHSGSGR